MQLERIEITPVAPIVGPLISGRRTGNLLIIRGSIRTTVFFSNGEVVLIAPGRPAESLAAFLVAKGICSEEEAGTLTGQDPLLVVERFHESGKLDRATRHALLREWTAALFIPLLALDEGTAVFTEEDAIAPETRVLLPSTVGLFLEGVRSITNGLVLRRSLGDLKSVISTVRGGMYSAETLPLNDEERQIAESLGEPRTIDAFIKHFAAHSAIAARVAIALLALGVFVEAQEPSVSSHGSVEDMQRDMEVLAALGASNPRALRAFAFSRRLPSMNHYEVLDVVRSAARAQIVTQGERLKKSYELSEFPPVIHEAVVAIRRRIDDAVATLTHPARRPAYDALLTEHGSITDEALNRLVTQRALAERNIARARDMAAEEDYYGAILLLKESLRVLRDHAEGWLLLGSCQERNPQWRRQAAESYQNALAAAPGNVDALISLGDIYKAEGLTSRAQACYEDAIAADPENPLPKSRLAAVKKKR